MKFIRLPARYSLLDHRRNEDILEGIKVDPFEKVLSQYKQKRLNHVSKRKEDIKILKTTL
jgi:hypothetical protein